MPKPFDAALKHLITEHPADWLERLGIPIAEPPEVLSVDLSTVTATADTLIRAGELVVHIDLQAGPDPDLGTRILLYNVLAHRATGLPVRSVVVLLRSNAQRASDSDRVEYEDLRFRFRIIKVWEIPADDWLTCGIGVLPLAVLGKPPPGQTREEALPDLVHRLADRAEQEAGDAAGQVLTAAYILSGMHFDTEVSRAIFTKVLAMHESSTYLAILEEGAVAHTRELLLRVGTEKYGKPTPEQVGKLKRIENLERLDRLAVRLLKVDSWDALLKGR